MNLRGKRVFQIATSIAGLALLVVALLPAKSYATGQITNRTLTLQAGASDGGSKPAGVVNHLFSFTLPTAGNISSIKFQYCTTADIDIGGTCTTPTGLVTTSATLGTQTGVNFTSLNNTTNGSPYLTAASPIGIVTSGGGQNNVVSFQLLTVTNPDATNCGGQPNCTFFVRISTYASTDTTGSPVDSGTVAASTSTQIKLTGTMPESLIFCTGGTINVNGSGIPDCTTASSGDITFNQLFSPTATSYATSQMAASTNALSGYSITVAGPTLTSGTNTIPAIGGTAATSNIGTGQFGMNLVANTTPTVGTAITPTSNTTNLRANPTTNFGTADSFAFDASSANTIANSDNNTPGSAAPTDSQIYTASYIVNVSGSQVAGTYTTTLTYICTPTF